MKVGVSHTAWTCGCNAGYQCIFGCEHPHLAHECAAVTSVPTPVPTPVHQCLDGSHNCDKSAGGECVQTGSEHNAWACRCKSGYRCIGVEACQHPYQNHSCSLITPAPTPAPTQHQCDNGMHKCDKNGGGTCVKVALAHDAWICGCQAGYQCTGGCTYPHVAHTCTAETPAPTPKQSPCDNLGTRVCDSKANGGACSFFGSIQACQCNSGYTCTAGCNYPFAGHKCAAPTPV